MENFLLGKNFQVLSTGTLETQGDCSSTITARENVKVGSKTIDCWRLSHRISTSGETVVDNQAVSVTISGDASSWIDAKNGALIKVNLPFSINYKDPNIEQVLQDNIMMELVEYQAP